IVAALAREGIAAHSRCAEGPDYTGVWVPGDAQAAGGRARERKIASIGVHVSRGVSTHGFAVNVTNDLAPFTWIVACGLPDVEMTSLAHELPPERIPDPAGLRERVARCFCEAHGRRMHTISPVDLDLPADLAHDGAPAVAPLQGAPA
ncbi:MAG TPA: hypothetical protein VMG62_02850, partial [Solirubrobacteraceae bacterium]|nr:hypothetical protein [Solirubrobacteraceae bacterium]